MSINMKRGRGIELAFDPDHRIVVIVILAVRHAIVKQKSPPAIRQNTYNSPLICLVFKGILLNNG